MKKPAMNKLIKAVKRVLFVPAIAALSACASSSPSLIQQRSVGSCGNEDYRAYDVEAAAFNTVEGYRAEGHVRDAVVVLTNKKNNRVYRVRWHEAGPEAMNVSGDGYAEVTTLFANPRENDENAWTKETSLKRVFGRWIVKDSWPRQYETTPADLRDNQSAINAADAMEKIVFHKGNGGKRCVYEHPGDVEAVWNNLVIKRTWDSKKAAGKKPIKPAQKTRTPVRKKGPEVK